MPAPLRTDASLPEAAGETPAPVLAAVPAAEAAATGQAGPNIPPGPAGTPSVILKKTAEQAATEGGRLWDVLLNQPDDKQILADINIPQLSIPQREEADIKLFQERGANAGAPLVLERGQAPPLDVFDRVIVQEADRPDRRNLFVVKKGKSDRFVVVGGHLDKVRAGNGIIDNLTGARMTIHLYQSLRAVETDANIVFINFTREEEGLLGSKFWLRSLPKELRAKIDAMFNLDTMAIDATAVMKNGATPKLEALLVGLAGRLGIPIVEGIITGGDSDHTSFRRAGIPALMEYGASSEEKIFDIIHTEKDNFSAFSLERYKDNIRLALEFLKLLSGAPVREPILTIGKNAWDAAGPLASAAFAQASRISGLIADEDFEGLRQAAAAIADAASRLTDHPKLAGQLKRAMGVIEEVLWADARDHGFERIIEARRLGAEGRRLDAARKYEEAAGFYRRSGPDGDREAENLLLLARRERAGLKQPAPG